MTMECWDLNVSPLISLPSFETLGPATATMVVDGINLPPSDSPAYTIGGSVFQYNFACRVRGGFVASTSGPAQFASSSDDGSQIFIDGNLLVDNGGTHNQGDVRLTGEINLVGGQYHTFEATYFQGGGGADWTVTWKPPGATSFVSFNSNAQQPPFPPSPPAAPPAPPYVQLVIAAYAENVSFIDPMLARMPRSEVRLYCKGPRIHDPRCIRIGNYGGEGYAYLTHIVRNYHNLSEITLFSLGSILNSEWHFFKCRKLYHLVGNLMTIEEQDNYPEYDAVDGADPWSPFQPFEYSFELASYRTHAGGAWEPLCRASRQPYGAWWQNMVTDDLNRPQTTGVTYHGTFAARRSQILQWPKSMYEGLLAEYERCEPAQPQEAGHYMERTWKPLFCPYGRAGTGTLRARELWDCPADVVALGHDMSRRRGTVDRDALLESYDFPYTPEDPESPGR